MHFYLDKLAGNTPLIKVAPRIYAKLETFNPTGSVKDRVITYLVRKAIDRDQINSETVFCEATSGNTGISLSACAAHLGLPCKIFMPSNMSIERRQMMEAYGAEIIFSDPDDFQGAISMRDEFISSNNCSWSPMQFSNQENIICHRETTAREIFKDVELLDDKRLAYFVHGAGTGGTIEGFRQYVVESAANVKICMVEPEESPHGIQGIADGKEFLAESKKMDKVISVSTDEAIRKAISFSKNTGLLVGISAGANLVASEKLLPSLKNSDIIVTMLCDRGERYMSIFGEFK